VDKVRLISSREFLKRREEPFCRVSVHQMEELLSEYEADQYEGVQDFEQNMSDGPRVVTHEEEAVAAYDRPYLILDVRGPSEFASCHLLQARNFPAVLLNQDKMTSEVFRYKNLEHSLIILYCEDERISTQTASRLVQRVGYL
jgi:centrosomal protein CEP41